MPLLMNLKRLGITVPQLAGPFGAYIPARIFNGLVYVSGQLPMKDGKLIATGQVPGKCSPDQARDAARQCVINALAAAQTVVGNLDDLVGVLRVGAFVSSDVGFTEQPKIANAASELLIELFGQPSGQHVRAAVGTNTLPLDASVEIEFIFLVQSDLTQ